MLFTIASDICIRASIISNLYLIHSTIDTSNTQPSCLQNAVQELHMMPRRGKDNGGLILRHKLSQDPDEGGKLVLLPANIRQDSQL